VGTGILQNNDKWKGIMPLYSLALESGKHTPVRLIAISSVSGAILKVLSSCVKQSLHRPYGSRRLKLPEFLDKWHTKVTRLQPYTTAAIRPHEMFPDNVSN
jgi:hypothetical protein